MGLVAIEQAANQLTSEFACAATAVLASSSGIVTSATKQRAGKPSQTILWLVVLFAATQR